MYQEIQDLAAELKGKTFQYLTPLLYYVFESKLDNIITKYVQPTYYMHQKIKFQYDHQQLDNNNHMQVDLDINNDNNEDTGDNSI